ncbi:MAG TPA: hypothetical protein PLN31_00150 [Azoarcus taiwanensis]|nr:hypothetical protein [Azoarcus taiwanensis]
MLRPTLVFIVLSLALFALRPSAALMDRIVAAVTDNRLRVANTTGHLWRGTGLLAITSDRRALTPMRQLEWAITPDWKRFGLIMELSEHGRHQASITARASGVGIELNNLEVPVELIARSLAHPAARVGWGGSLSLDSPGMNCDWWGNCNGLLSAQWRDVSLEIVPDRHLGDHGIELTARGDAFDIAVGTLHGDIRIEGQGRFGQREAPFFRGTVEGDPEIVDRIPNIMDRNARPSGQSGRVHISLP